MAISKITTLILKTDLKTSLLKIINRQAAGVQLLRREASLFFWKQFDGGDAREERVEIECLEIFFL